MNRLAAETSPYLRQHAENPVDWFPWGDDAFAEARRRDVPIFLSVGYSACHWCHVMAHESFEDTAVAEQLNRQFVNVKVDREERPDVDSIYMQATQAMTGRGGWPMSVWLFPDGRPFYTGTYFPPADRPGMPSFTRICDAIADAWTNRRDELDEAGQQLTATLDRGLPDVDAVTLDAAVLNAAVAHLAAEFDPAWGGFGGAPKFPAAATIALLCRRYLHDPQPQTRTMITTTLDAMAAGGMYDQVGGGFARYSVDEYWLVPHFEKMLYDNAQLIRAYTHGWLVTREPRYRRVVEETIAYCLRDLRHADGGFFSAEDADSEGVEGKFYLWSLAELTEVCGPDATAAIEYYGVTANGNFVDPHTQFRGNVLHLVDRTREPDAQVLRARTALFERRRSRIRPGLDDKVLLAWNGLMVRALADAAAVFDRDDWLDAARRCARFCLERLRRDDGRLLRSWQADANPLEGWGRDGRGRHLAYGDDYGSFLEALVTLVERDSLEWLDAAREVATGLVTLFHDDAGGGFFTSGNDATPLIVRPKDQMDNATPSENSLAANGLLRLAAITGDDTLAATASRAIANVAPFFARLPTGFAYAMEAAQRLFEPSREIAIVGARDDPRTQRLRRTVAERLLPNTVTVCAEPGAAELPLLTGRGLVNGAPAAYVCENYVCALPVTDAHELAMLLDAQRAQ